MGKAWLERGLAEAPLVLQLDTAETDPGATTVHGADGHRARMRDRLLKAGADALADHEMLEMVLFLALPRRDTKPIARALMARFGSFRAVISASVQEMLKTQGLGEAGAAALKTVHAAAVRLVRSNVLGQPVLASWDRLMDYLNAVMAHEPTEQVRVLFLDNRNRLLGDEVLGRGTVNHAPVYPREIVRRALDLHAVGFILVHNHPSGDPSPSREDVAMTREIQQAAATLGIALHDHIIIGAGSWISFRTQGLI